MVAGASVGLARTPAGLSPAASGVTLLSSAVEAGEAGRVSALLKARADPCGSTPKGVSPLHLAAYCDSPSTLGLLVEARADVNARDCHGQSPIFFAGTPEICSRLEAAGADVNLRNRKGQSALHLAAGAGLDEVVAWLAARVAPGILNAQDRHGCTALHCAKSGGLRSTARLLQERGASDRIRPVAGRRRGGWAARAAGAGAGQAGLVGIASSVCTTDVSGDRGSADSLSLSAPGLEDVADSFLKSLQLDSPRMAATVPRGSLGSNLDEAEAFLTSLKVTYAMARHDSASEVIGYGQEGELPRRVEDEADEFLESMSRISSCVTEEVQEARSAYGALSTSLDELKRIMAETSGHPSGAAKKGLTGGARGSLAGLPAVQVPLACAASEVVSAAAPSSSTLAEDVQSARRALGSFGASIDEMRAAVSEAASCASRGRERSSGHAHETDARGPTAEGQTDTDAAAAVRGSGAECAAERELGGATARGTGLRAAAAAGAEPPAPPPARSREEAAAGPPAEGGGAAAAAAASAPRAPAPRRGLLALASRAVRRLPFLGRR